MSSNPVLVFPVCDYLGERMASLFGISSPKYQYAIDEYYRMKKEVIHNTYTCRDRYKLLLFAEINLCPDSSFMEQIGI